MLAPSGAIRFPKEVAVVDHRLILGLLLQGRSYREIADVASCSQRDISRARKVLTANSLSQSALDALADADLRNLFPDGRSRVSESYEAPEFAQVVKSMKANRHFTLLQAWRNYTAGNSALRKYGYAQYCHLFDQYARTNDLVATLKHEPGRCCFIDWAGDTVPLVDPITGEVTKAYLFLVVLPYSGYLYVRAYLDMKMGSWIDGHIRSYEFFGGVPQITVPDNALTATHRPERGEAARAVSQRYQQMADHYGTAIVPTRVRKPRDKAAVESGVNVANKRILGYLLEETWTSLAELNAAIEERLAEINHEIRRANGTTRFELFTDEEAAHLGPLPDERFEEVEWKEAKVARNYHVSCESQHYSVPFKFAGTLVRVRLTSGVVTVFDGNDIIASHQRLTGRKGQYSTNPEHVPPQHRNIHGLWSRSWFLDRAATFGPATVQVIEQVLDRKMIEAQGYLDCQNILESLGKKNHARLEAACQALLNMGGYPSYSALKRLIAGINSDAEKPAPLRAAASNLKPTTADDVAVGVGISIRGADYYKAVS